MLERLNEELNSINPNDAVSPRLLARKVKLPLATTEEILIDLSYEKIIGVKYIVTCRNPQEDYQHAFTFLQRKELVKFILLKGRKCPDCGSPLNTDDIRVAFIIMEQQLT